MGERQPDYEGIILTLLDWYKGVDGVSPPKPSNLEMKPLETYVYASVYDLFNKEMVKGIY
ncbi:hypothetical protein NVP1264O_45 [Vibrio phage 1.264.O._10N.286.51.F2]|nr:hypothetical protein NVP1264O_45 [Vibrio phage 1.264.O._10N.286.51.F2]